MRGMGASLGGTTMRRWWLRTLVLGWLATGQVHAQESHRNWRVGDTAVGIDGKASTVTQVYTWQGRQVVVARDDATGLQRWWYGDAAGSRTPSDQGVAARPRDQQEQAKWGREMTQQEWFWYGFRKKPRRN